MTQADLPAKESSLNYWNISDAPLDKRSKNKWAKWEAREFPLTLWSTRKWEGLILVYTDLTQQLLITAVINMSMRRILLSPVGDPSVDERLDMTALLRERDRELKSRQVSLLETAEDAHAVLHRKHIPNIILPYIWTVSLLRNKAAC